MKTVRSTLLFFPLLLGLSYAALAAGPPPKPKAAEANPAKSEKQFAVGADISWVQQEEDRGKKYTDKGETKEILALLGDRGFNWIRLRLFVDPKAERGYSRQGYCDLEHTLAMAKRIKAAKMKFLLDFHYSDNWADPGKQFKPAAWQNLSFDDLKKAVEKHTADVLTALKNQGTLPDMVQIGNEIHHGILWPDGQINDNGGWDRFADLIKAGISGAKSVDPSMRIMLHLASGGQNEESRYFLDNVIKRGVKFDVIGESYYPRWHGTLEDLKKNLNDLVTRYPQEIAVAEYSVPNIREINDIVRELPNGRGLGTFIWEPTRWEGALFENDGTTKPEMETYSKMVADYAAKKP